MNLNDIRRDELGLFQCSEWKRPEADPNPVVQVLFHISQYF